MPVADSAAAAVLAALLQKPAEAGGRGQKETQNERKAGKSKSRKINKAHHLLT